MHIPRGVSKNLGWATGWLPDQNYPEPTSDEGFVSNKNMVNRKKICLASRKFWMINKLFIPLFNQPKLIPTNIDLQIYIYLNTSDFCLMTPKTGKKCVLKVHEAEIAVNKIQLQDKWFQHYQSFISRNPVIYDFTDFFMSQFAIPSNTIMKTLSQVSLPVYPKRYRG